MINIRLATEKDQPAWDEYVCHQPLSGPYHLFGWKTAVEEAYGHKGYYLLVEDGSRSIAGIFPTICFKMPWGKKILVSLPYCDYAGPLGSSEAQSALVEHCKKLAQKLGATHIDIRLANNSDAINRLRLHECLAHKVRMVLPLPDSSEALWNGFKSKLRSQIRKAKKNGLVFSWGTRDDVGAFYKVFSKNMHDLGSPVHSRRWIEAVLKNYSQNAKMGLVFKENTPVGCGIILCTPTTVSIPWASTLRKYNRLGPNMLLYWNFLKYAADTGRKQFDFGRSTPGEGTWRFKKQWGAEAIPLKWYIYASKGSMKSEQNKTENAAIRRNIAGIWSKLPFPVANLLGPKLRKYISL